MDRMLLPHEWKRKSSWKKNYFVFAALLVIFSMIIIGTDFECQNANASDIEAISLRRREVRALEDIRDSLRRIEVKMNTK